MVYDRVREGETLGEMSARLGVPACMLLRANRVFSPAWLLPGREICVPSGAFCEEDGFICPALAVRVAAWTRNGAENGYIQPAEAYLPPAEDTFLV